MQPDVPPVPPEVAPLLTKPVAALSLGVSERLLRIMIKEGRLKTMMVGRRQYVLRASVTALRAKLGMPC